MKTSILKQNVGIDISMDDFKVSVQSLTSSLSIKVKGAKTFTNDLRGRKRTRLRLSDSFCFTLRFAWLGPVSGTDG